MPHQSTIDSDNRLILEAGIHDIVGLTLRSNSVVILQSGAVIRPSGEGVVFNIEPGSSNVSITGEQGSVIDGVNTTGSVIHFNTAAGSYEQIKFSGVTVLNSNCVMSDDNSTGLIVGLSVSKVISFNPRGPQYKLRDAFAFTFFHEVTVDFTRNTSVPNYVAFSFENFHGLKLTDVEVSGGFAASNFLNNGISLRNGQAAWLDKCMGDTVGGVGIIVDNVRHLNATNLTGSLCGYGQITISNCFSVNANGLISVGRLAADGVPAQARGLFLLQNTNSVFTNILSDSSTGAGIVSYGNVNSKVSNYLAHDNVQDIWQNDNLLTL